MKISIAFLERYATLYGYIIFTTENDYHKCSHLRITKKTNVPYGITRIAGYQRFGSPLR